MYIKKLRIRDIKGFAKLEFDFTRPDQSYAGWTVFTGNNGSGKSTLLKAIAIALVGKDTARSLQPGFQRWIRDGARDARAEIQLEMVLCVDDDTLAESGKKPASSFPALIVLENGGKDIKLDSPVPARKNANYATPQRTIWSSDAGGWVSCGYGPFRRIFGASPEAMRQMVSPTTERFVTMFQEAASLKEVDEWLRGLKYKELENKTAEKEQLALVLAFLRDDLLPNGITVDRVDSDGLWLRDKNGVLLSWSEMSDGYRAATALLTDILRHLIGSYGIEGLVETVDGKTVVKRSGVVLIDEIDAHLHPEWQRGIGFWLKSHFPHIQFLVTSHSPLICQAADPNGLFVLPEPGGEDLPRALTDDEYKRVIASRPDTILLTPAFGLRNTRSPVAVEKRAGLAKLNAKKRSGAELTQGEQLEFDANSFYITTDEDD